MPTINLPVKSYDKTFTTLMPRRHVSIVKDTVNVDSAISKAPTYKNIEDFKKKVSKLKLHGWCIELFELKVHIKKMSESYVLPVYEIVVDDALEFTCTYSWLVPTCR